MYVLACNRVRVRHLEAGSESMYIETPLESTTDETALLEAKQVFKDIKAEASRKWGSQVTIQSPRVREIRKIGKPPK